MLVYPLEKELSLSIKRCIYLPRREFKFVLISDFSVFPFHLQLPNTVSNKDYDLLFPGEMEFIFY